MTAIPAIQTLYRILAQVAGKPAHLPLADLVDDITLGDFLQVIEHCTKQPTWDMTEINTQCELFWLFEPEPQRTEGDKHREWMFYKGQRL